MGNTPVFMLCPGRSFSSVVCGMIGVHPQLYALSEVYLFCADTVHELRSYLSRPQLRTLFHGLLRVIAELEMGEQTEENADKAAAWLEERDNWSTTAIYEHIVERVAPRRCVDKTPAYTRPENLCRVYEAYPDAKFLHIARHPRSFMTSRIKVFEDKATRKNIAARKTDPDENEKHWVKANSAVLEFTAHLQPGQSMFLQGEQLLSDPDRYLVQIAEWLEVDASPESIEAMKHPETSPYARPGPINARGGNNRKFIESPELKIMKYPKPSLDQPPEDGTDWWRFSPATLELARRLGYQ